MVFIYGIAMDEFYLTGRCRFRINNEKLLILQVEEVFEDHLNMSSFWRDATIEDITVNNYLKEFIVPELKEKRKT